MGFLFKYNLMLKIKDHILYLVLSSEACSIPVLDVAEQAIYAGIDILQMREKNKPRKRLISLGKKLLSLCRKKGIPFIVNDDPYIACEIGADGVHLGQEDIRKYPLSRVRGLLGRDRIIGISTHSLCELCCADSKNFDYMAYGPVYPTKTKDYFIGTGDVSKAAFLCKKPVIFIGGIDPIKAAVLVKYGAKNIAVIRAITQSENIESSVKLLKKAIA